ncbi:hypothetical protein [Aliikangiella sp. IMCC44359]|uniref:hypothetical protein n=1 Tax=Aliikangiella sp. IMCC44359 TaxID=3459125 RepID=UPI00403AD208
MKKTLLTVAAGVLLNSTTALKANQTDALIEFSIKQMEESIDLDGISQCLGVSKSKFLNAQRNTMRYCFESQGEGKQSFDKISEDAMNDCFENQTKQRLELSDSIIQKCKEQFADDEPKDIDYSNLSDEEFEKHTEEQKQEGKKAIDDMLALSKAVSKNTEHLVTLPIFPKSQIMSHYQDGLIIGEEKTLPVAMFTSSEEIKKVIDFYAKKLPEFDKKEITGGLTIFMRNIPKNFDPLKDMVLYQKTPHVTITQLPSSSKKVEVSIEIAYKK